MSLTPEQIEMRRTVVGSSEVGALVDYYAPREERVDPYKTALDVFASKTLPREEKTEEDHRHWGLDLEPAILANHVRRMGYLRAEPPGTLLHATHPLCATPDALVFTKEDRVRDVQIKNEQGWGALRWGEPGGDDFPLLYVAQVTVELGVLRAHRTDALRDYRDRLDEVADLAVSVRGAPPVAYHLPYDEDLFLALAELAARFKRDHLDTGKPPPVDGSDSAAEFIRRRYPKDDGRMLPADAQAAALVQAVASMRATCAAAKDETQAAENQLKELIGEASGIEGLCSWKRNKDTIAKVTDWEAVAHFVAKCPYGPEKLREAIPLFTTEKVTREGSRVLRLIKPKEA